MGLPSSNTASSLRPQRGERLKNSFNRSTLDMTNNDLARGPGADTAPVNIPAPAVAKSSYSGKISLSEADQRALILNISFVRGSISGNANVAGMGEFRVDGKELARGFEIFLYGAQGNLRLTGSKRGKNSLKGRFSFPSKSLNGSWNATSVN